MHKNILVIGKNGQLGQSIKKLLSSNCFKPLGKSVPNYFKFTFIGRDELDLSDIDNIQLYFKEKAFDAIVNCAAYTAVDKAESEPKLADKINHLAVRKLSEIAKFNNTLLIHISTDYVFDGVVQCSYSETDDTTPINEYGLSKLNGEYSMMDVNPNGFIIRTSWVYSEFGNNFVKTMLRVGKDRDEISVVDDQIGSPTYASDLAHCIIVLLITSFDNQLKEPLGVELYHYSNEGCCSWKEFAEAIFKFSSTNCFVTPIKTVDYKFEAKRPEYSLMNKSKIMMLGGIEVPHWEVSLDKCLKNLVS